MIRIACFRLSKGSRQKVLLLMAGPLRGGGGGPLRKKTFFGTFFSNFPTAIKLEGARGLGRKRITFFFAASLTCLCNSNLDPDQVLRN